MNEIYMEGLDDTGPIDAEGTIKRMLALEDDAQKHFGKLIGLLLNCYGPDATGSALVLTVDHENTFRIMPIRADMQDMLDMMENGERILEEYNTHDAPPKEMFN